MVSLGFVIKNGRQDDEWMKGIDTERKKKKRVHMYVYNHRIESTRVGGGWG